MIKKHRVICAVLVLMLAVWMLPLSAFAEDSTKDMWNGTQDFSWFNESSPQIGYTLTTAEQLAGLAYLTNDKGMNFSGITITLGEDLDISGHVWESIAVSTGGNGFAGVFDGNGHTISGLTHTGEALAGNAQYGLFGCVRDGGVVKNLGLTDCAIDIPDTAKLKEQNASISGFSSDRVQVGVLTAELHNATIENCYTDGTAKVSADGSEVGGIAASVTSDDNQNADGKVTPAIIRQSYSLLEITMNGVGFAAGVAGRSETSGTNKTLIEDCYFGGSITSDAVSSLSGILGIQTGEEKTLSITNVYSNAQLTNTNEKGMTFAIGMMQNGTATHAYWDGKQAYSAAVQKCDANGKFTLDDKEDVFYTEQVVECEAVNEFQTDAVIKKLAEQSLNNVEWVKGITGPTFAEDPFNRLADYTVVDTAIAKIPTDLTPYTDDTVQALELAKNAVVLDKIAAQQAEVDAMAQEIEDAFAALEYKEADYTKVDEAIAKANALNRADYKDFSAVDTAVSAVVREKKITEQAEVDGYAEAIETAIASLEKNSAESGGTSSDTTSSGTATPGPTGSKPTGSTPSGSKPSGSTGSTGTSTPNVATGTGELKGSTGAGGASGSGSSKATTPQTGDKMNAVLPLVLLGAGGGLSGLLVLRRKRLAKINK